MNFGSMLKDYLEYYKISQTDFAMRLGISTKHMNEVLNGNAYLSLDLMHVVSLLTNIDVNLIFYVENKNKVHKYLEKNFSSEKEKKDFLNSFYLKELEEKKWIKLKDKENIDQKALDLLEFLNVKDFDSVNKYMNNKVLYKKNDDANLTKIYLWLKHCEKFILQESIVEYQSSKLDALLNELKKIRLKKFNAQELIKLFANYGIYLIIEDALKGTKIRGAVDVRGSNPVIYMTKFYKEKSSFYYALYHELGHIKTNYNIAKNKVIIEISDKDIEEKCDKFALDQMIAPKIWEEIKINAQERENICKLNNIPLSFLYSRLAYEKIISYSSKEYNNHKEKI